jgi:hypothetical protein
LQNYAKKEKPPNPRRGNSKKSKGKMHFIFAKSTSIVLEINNSIFHPNKGL